MLESLFEFSTSGRGAERGVWIQTVGFLLQVWNAFAGFDVTLLESAFG